MEVIIEVDSSCCSWSTTTQGFLDKFVEIVGIAIPTIAAIAVMLDITELAAVTAAIASMLLASLDLLRLRS